MKDKYQAPAIIAEFTLCTNCQREIDNDIAAAAQWEAGKCQVCGVVKEKVEGVERIWVKKS